jgi:hypothetical protein
MHVVTVMPPWLAPSEMLADRSTIDSYTAEGDGEQNTQPGENT